jgi:inhibitor of cysteine peptidase
MIFPKNKMIIIYVIIFCFCFFDKAMAADKINSESFYTENQVNIVIEKNQPQFLIKLKSNPTTGYSWFLREYNANLIEPLKHQFEKSTKPMIGAGGYEIWTFRAKPAGFIVPQRTQIRLVYARPWQANESATILTFWLTMRP